MNFTELHEYWFGDGSLVDPKYVGERMRFWFSKDAAVDSEIRRRFAPWLAAYPAEAFTTAAKSERGLLTQVILLDQVPRNSFRGTPRAFAWDSFARDLARRGLALGYDKSLSSIEAIFFLLPLEHSEALADQEESLQRYGELLERTPEPLRKITSSTLEYAHRHWEVIKRFGRFPHRNQALGRPSTDEEIEFLNQPGSVF